MNMKNTNKLITDYPILYRGHTKSPRESLMCFGFDCEDGWYDLIYTLSAALTNHMNEQPGLSVEVVQVKEKFGTLRYYIHGGDSYCEKLISEAARRSGLTCEDCGQPAQLNRHNDSLPALCI